MICDSVRRQLEQLRRDTGSEVYVVKIESPDSVVALVIPRDARGKEVLNPEGTVRDMEGLVERLSSGSDDWGQMTDSSASCPSVVAE
ncbi:MAG TPA: hypothetical protein VII14_19865 [Xanthobacteraceae bacterium]|jgi:hypothetical protein